MAHEQGFVVNDVLLLSILKHSCRPVAHYTLLELLYAMFSACVAVEQSFTPTVHRPRRDLRGKVDIHGAVRETAGCREDYWIAVDSDRLFYYYYTQSEKIKDFE